MEELLEKISELKKQLDTLEAVKNIKQLNKKIKSDTNLIKLLEEYHSFALEETKKKIISNKLFTEYKEAETNINILILKINQRLKNIKEKGSCKL